MALGGYALLAFVLWKQNKYNLKNFWFVLGSFALVPLVFFQLSLYFAASKVDNRIVEPAQSYACSIAAKVDNYTKNLPATINDAVGNVVAKTSESIQNKVADELSSVIGAVQDSLDTLAESALDVAITKSSNTIDETVGLVTDAVDVSVNKAMMMLPTNLVGELKEKFPALSIFLTDQGIEGSNGEEIITSVFSKATTAIRHLKNSRVLALFKYLLIFTVLAIFFGRRKLKRIQKKEEVNASVQDNTKSIE